MKYARYKQLGGTFFFTLVTFNRRKIFLDPQNSQLFMDSMGHVQNKHPFETIAYCICPDHIHTIWNLPATDNDFPTRWRLIKSYFTHRFHDAEKFQISASRKIKGELAVWQRRYWEHHIRNEIDLKNHIEYILTIR